MESGKEGVGEKEGFCDIARANVKMFDCGARVLAKINTGVKVNPFDLMGWADGLRSTAHIYEA